MAHVIFHNFQKIILLNLIQKNFIQKFIPVDFFKAELNFLLLNILQEILVIPFLCTLFLLIYLINLYIYPY
jgi:hypothetical protein